ncbi:MAG TPA: glycosyltransferase [Elusimicrobia bacterium]|nr:glycosyltransferase [Elusimicrobiota bacterium]
MKNLNLEITIPVLNEEKRLETGLSKTIEFLNKNNISDYRIVIADNGSTDKTETIAGLLEKKYPQVHFIKVGQKGVGLALKKSWNNSNADIIGYMDVDLATDLNHLIDMLNAMQNSEINVVNGSRILRHSNVKNRSALREVTSRGFNFILKIILNVNFTDGMCGFKFIKRDAYNRLMKAGLDNNDWFFCSEMLIKAEWLGLKIFEIPVRWNDDGDSRVDISKTIYKYIKEIIKLRFGKKLWIKKTTSIS